jgi:two-component system OmpR family sensor kinase
MMLLFCAAVGVLLAGSFLILYAWLARSTRTEFDRRVLEAQAPVAADIVSDGDAEDVSQLNLPNEYFEVIERSGHVLARSLNLASGSLPLPEGALGVQSSTLFDISHSVHGPLRLAAVPVRIGKTQAVLFLAMPTGRRERTLADLRRGLGALLALSLAVMALLSAWYVGRSLRPIVALTEHASRLGKRLETPGGALAVDPLPQGLEGRTDEIGQLAEAFDELWERMRNAVTQLRQFVSDASHELRTPLAVLRGETELVLGEPRNEEEYRRALEVIQDELGKLGRIVDGLFTLTLADAGQLRLAREPLYLNEVLEEACAIEESRARTKNIHIERSLEAEFAYLGDETWLRQLFLAFLDNAAKYSPGGTRVSVALEARDGLGPRVTIEDEGPGIAPENLPHIFERFYRAGSDEAQSGGLGLAIAQAIVRACGGKIECSSRLGEGTRFTVDLPVVPPEANLNEN